MISNQHLQITTDEIKIRGTGPTSDQRKSLCLDIRYIFVCTLFFSVFSKVNRKYQHRKDVATFRPKKENSKNNRRRFTLFGSGKVGFAILLLLFVSFTNCKATLVLNQKKRVLPDEQKETSEAFVEDEPFENTSKAEKTSNSLFHSLTSQEPPKKHKIAFFTTYAPKRCGIAIFTQKLLPAFGDAEVTILSINGQNQAGIRRVELSNARWAKSLEREAQFLIDNNYTHLVLQHECSMSQNCWHFIELLRLVVGRIPTIVYLHNVSINPSLRALLMIREVSRLSTVVVVSGWTPYYALINMYAADPDKIRIVHHGAPSTQQSMKTAPTESKRGNVASKLLQTDNEGGTIRKRKRNILSRIIEMMKVHRLINFLFRKKKKYSKSDYAKQQEENILKKSKDDIVLITTGIMHEHKGVWQIIEMLPRLVKTYPKIHYYVVGVANSERSKFYMNNLVKRARSLNVGGNFTWIDRFVSDEELNRYVSSSDIYIALFEDLIPTSGTIILAMANGVPVVSTPNSFALEHIANGRITPGKYEYERGYIGSFREIEVNLRVVQTAIESKNRPTISKNCIKYTEMFSWDKMSLIFRDIVYSTTLSGKRSNITYKPSEAARKEANKNQKSTNGSYQSVKEDKTWIVEEKNSPRSAKKNETAPPTSETSKEIPIVIQNPFTDHYAAAPYKKHEFLGLEIESTKKPNEKRDNSTMKLKESAREKAKAMKNKNKIQIKNLQSLKSPESSSTQASSDFQKELEGIDKSVHREDINISNKNAQYATQSTKAIVDAGCVSLPCIRNNEVVSFRMTKALNTLANGIYVLYADAYLQINIDVRDGTIYRIGARTENGYLYVSREYTNIMGLPDKSLDCVIGETIRCVSPNIDFLVLNSTLDIYVSRVKPFVQVRGLFSRLSCVQYFKGNCFFNYEVFRVSTNYLFETDNEGQSGSVDGVRMNTIDLQKNKMSIAGDLMHFGRLNHTRKNIVVEGYLYNNSGFSAVNRNIALELMKKGTFNVILNPIDAAIAESMLNFDQYKRTEYQKSEEVKKPKTKIMVGLKSITQKLRWRNKNEPSDEENRDVYSENKERYLKLLVNDAHDYFNELEYNEDKENRNYSKLLTTKRVKTFSKVEEKFSLPINSFSLEKYVLAEHYVSQRKIASSDGNCSLVFNEEKVPTIIFRNMFPPKFQKPPFRSKWIINQPWEFSQIPNYWIDPLNSVDSLWTPSNYCSKVYADSGVNKDRTKVVPHGVDTHRLQRMALKVEKDSRFTFLLIGGSLPRKGLDLALKAYTRAFTAKDNVRLIVHTNYGIGFGLNEIKKIMSTPNSPLIELSASNKNEIDIIKLYRRSDALILPYRSEGFGLVILEALAHGVIPIVTNYGPSTEFCNKDACLFVDYVETECTLPPCRNTSIFGFSTKGVPKWAEPKLESIENAIKKVYADRNKLEGMRNSGKKICELYSWENVGRLIEKNFNNMFSANSA